VTLRGFVARGGGQKSLTRVKGEIKIWDRQGWGNDGGRWDGERGGGRKVRIARNLLVPVQVCRNEIVKFQSTLEALSTGEVPPRCALPNGILPSFPPLLLPAHPSRGCSSFFPEEDVRFLPLFGADSNSAGKKEEVN